MANRKRSNILSLGRHRPEVRRQLLERLFVDHGSALRSFLLVRLEDRADMEDIVQEVFLRLERLEDLEVRLNEGEARNRAFMIAIANNLVLDLERSRRVRRNYAESEQHAASEDAGVDTSSPESMAVTHQELDWLKQEILKLKPTWREAFVLNRFHHLSYREIAQKMSVTVSQVEKYMMSALKQIRQAAKTARGEQSL
ncbi:RNA polymerase sigma factor [Porticoccaceae bacterium LTM1]|nr:RNA polymerase sigma factor [Porticoccaceae bacterium LTM1]